MTQILLKDKDAAEMLAIGISTLWEYSKKGKIPAPIKIGSRTRWRADDLIRFIADLPATSTTNS